MCCDSAGIQTRNLLIRSQMLYSVELRSPARKPKSDSAGIQTRNLLIRSQMLYSVELRSLSVLFCECKDNGFFFTQAFFPPFSLKKIATELSVIVLSHHFYRQMMALSYFVPPFTISTPCGACMSETTLPFAPTLCEIFITP